MAREIYKTVPLDDQLIPEVLRGSNFTNETSAHQFIITCTKNNEPVRLTGSVRGRFIAADNTSFLIDGNIVSGNAVVTLHQDCYHAPGRFQFVIFNTNGTENVAIYAAVGEVRRSDTNELYITGEPLPDIDELLDAMGDLRDIIQNYDDIVLVQSEQPTSATNKIWIQPQADEYQVPTWQEHEDLAEEVADLKSALDGLFSEKAVFIDYLGAAGVSPTTGANTSNTSKRRTNFLEITAQAMVIRKLSAVYKWTIWTYSENKASTPVRSLTNNSLADTNVPVVFIRGDNENYFRIGFEKADATNFTETEETDIKNNTFLCTLTDKTLTKTNVAADAKAVGDALANATETIDGTIASNLGITLAVKRALTAQDDIDNFSTIGVFTKQGAVSPAGWPAKYANYASTFINTIATGAGIQIIVTSASSNNVKPAVVLYRIKSGGVFTAWISNFASKYTLSASDDINNIIDIGIYFAAENVKPLHWNMFQSNKGTGVLLNFINQVNETSGVQIAMTANGEIAYRVKTTVTETTPDGWRNWIIVRNETDNLSHYAIQYGTALLDLARPTIMGHNYANRCINFSFITDTHYGGTRLDLYESRHNLQLYADFSNEKFLDFAVHGGDLITDYDTNETEAINILDDSLEIMSSIRIPAFNCVGNHERNWSYVEVEDTSNLDWENTSYYAWDAEHVQLDRIYESEWIDRGRPALYTSTNAELLSPTQITLLLQNNIPGKVVDSENPVGGYFYRDFPELKLRCIFINSYPLSYDDEEESVVLVGQFPQAVWLANSALRFDDVSQWRVIIFAHDIAQANIENVLRAFKTGTKRQISSNYPDIYADFRTQGAGTLIAWIHGHRHSDTYTWQNGIPYIGVNAGFVRKETMLLNPEKAFCFSVFSVDTSSDIIYETRIGKWSSGSRTENRSWNYSTGVELT